MSRSPIRRRVRYAALTVSDTGSGIAPQIRDQIFDPFFTTKPPGKGTGLGLSTVYGIVKQSGGSILLDSEPGRGTKFTVLLPAIAAKLAKVTARPVLAMPTGTETILLAEDEAGVRSFVRWTLEKYGYQVLECSNGVEAMESSRNHPARIHLLLTDAVMPEMGGAELFEQFSASRPGVPVLCISGYNEGSLPGLGGEANCLRKPFTPAALLVRVREALDHREGHIAAGTA